MEKKEFKTVMKKILGKDLLRFYHTHTKLELEALGLIDYIKKFIVENKLGGKLMYYQGRFAVKIKSTEDIKNKLNKFLKENNCDVNFK